MQRLLTINKLTFLKTLIWKHGEKLYTHTNDLPIPVNVLYRAIKHPQTWRGTSRGTHSRCRLSRCVVVQEMYVLFGKVGRVAKQQPTLTEFSFAPIS